MPAFSEHNLGAYFPLFFAAIWLVVTTMLTFLSGWLGLMERYPDQAGEPILRLRGQSGSMGLGVNMRGILTLSVCASGLRVGMWRLFGPFCRSFLVPWESIAVVRKAGLFGSMVRLEFGNPPIGRLSIPAATADRLARAAMGRWPDATPIPEEKPAGRWLPLLVRWAIVTSLAALFFTLAPMLTMPEGARPPILVGILFPAVVFGAFFLIQYFVTKR